MAKELEHNQIIQALLLRYNERKDELDSLYKTIEILKKEINFSEKEANQNTMFQAPINNSSAKVKARMGDIVKIAAEMMKVKPVQKKDVYEEVIKQGYELEDDGYISTSLSSRKGKLFENKEGKWHLISDISEDSQSEEL